MVSENMARAKESKVHHAALRLQEKEKCSDPDCL
jgi:hypothetical protein